MLALDHILLGAPDLGAAAATVAGLAGVTPAGGGSHPGFGTRNQFLSLGERLFFEIIAPDPAQAESGHRAERLAGLAAPRLQTFCLNASDLSAVAGRATAAGLAVTDPVPMSRTRADGLRLEWEILYFDAPEWGESLPFVIDWKASPHPADASPAGCTLAGFTALHPDATGLRGLYDALGIDVPVAAAPAPGFVLRLDTPRGPVVLT